MARFCGNIGFVITAESATQPGVWVPTTTVRKYYGEILRNNRRWESDNKVNGDVAISNTFSVLIDDFLRSQFQYAKYIEYMGTKWEISSVEIDYPRMKIETGGLYNG